MTLLLKETLEQRILRIADGLQPGLQAAFLNAVAAAKSSIQIGQLADLFEEGDITGALVATSNPDDESLADNLQQKIIDEVKDALLEAVTESSQLAAIDLNLDFALVNESAVRFAQAQASSLVTNISIETEQAIRHIVVRGQREGLNARAQAQAIQRIVGLTDRDARAVDRFYMGLLDSGTNQARARELADRMAARLLKRRAENIARTETIRAANMGTQLSWQAAMDNGLLPRTTQKVWIAAQDSRTCAICAVLDGQVISVSTSFDVQERAASFTQEGGDFQVASKVPLKNPSMERTPPAHPSCRCTIGLVFAEGAAEPSAWDADEMKALSAESPLDWDERTIMDLGTGVDVDDLKTLRSRQEATQNALIEGGHEDFTDWTNRWLGGSTDELNSDISDVLTGNTQHLTESELDRAKAALAAMDNPPSPKPNTLYRGIAVAENDIAFFDIWDEWSIGSTPDWDFDSFAAEPMVADVFANASRVGRSTPVVFEWVGAGKALQLENLSTFAEAEWLGAGTFRVKDIREDTISGNFGFVVTIEQIATLGLGG